MTDPTPTVGQVTAAADRWAQTVLVQLRDTLEVLGWASVTVPEALILLDLEPGSPAEAMLWNLAARKEPT
jgi:hypothetical protein